MSSCSLANHTLQSQEKEGLVTMHTASCSGGNAIILKSVTGNHKHNAGLTVCTRATREGLLSNKFKSRIWLEATKSCRQNKSSSPDPLSLGLGVWRARLEQLLQCCQKLVTVTRNPKILEKILAPYGSQWRIQDSIKGGALLFVRGARAKDLRPRPFYRPRPPISMPPHPLVGVHYQESPCCPLSSPFIGLRSRSGSSYWWIS